MESLTFFCYSFTESSYTAFFQAPYKHVSVLTINAGVEIWCHYVSYLWSGED
jgi:hypothetical protein